MFDNTEADIQEFMRYRVALSAVDLKGAFDAFCDCLHSSWSLAGGARIESCEVAAKALGYSSHADLLANPNTSRLGRCPETIHRLVDLMAWRAYRAGLLSLPEAQLAMSRAFYASRLSIREVYDGFGHMIGLDSRRGLRGLAYHQRAAVRSPFHASNVVQTKFPFRSALNRQDRLFVEELAEGSLWAAAAYWVPNSGVSAQEVVDHVESTSYLPLSIAVTQGGRYLSGLTLPPPDLYPVEYLSSDQQLIGYGFKGQDVPLYLRWIYPTPEAFLEAWLALWRRSSPPPSTILGHETAVVSEIDANMFSEFEHRGLDHTAEFEDSVRLDRLVRRPVDDARRQEPEIVQIKDGAVDCGISFTALGDGAPYTRADEVRTLDEFKGLLGFVAPPVEASDEDWVRQLVPVALSEVTCETLYRVTSAFERLQDRGVSLCKEMSNEFLHFVTWAASNSAPVPSRTATRQLAYNQTLSMDMEHGREVLQAFPQLKGTPLEKLGVFAFEFWGKNGVRHDNLWERQDPLFVGYVTLRNLGCDPFGDASMHDQRWHAVLMLVFDLLSAEGDLAVRNSMLGRVKIDARKLLDRSESLFDLFSILGSAPDKRSRFFPDRFPNVAWDESWVDYRLGGIGESAEYHRRKKAAGGDVDRFALSPHPSA